MKKSLLLFFLMTFSLGQSQNLHLGFEIGESGGPSGVFGSMAAPVYETGTGTNTTRVLKIVTNTAGEVWQGSNFIFTTPVTLTTNKTMTIDVFASGPMFFLVKVNGGVSGALEAAAVVSYTGTNTWQTCSFTFNSVRDGRAAQANGTYNNFVIHPYWESATQVNFGTQKPPRTLWVDNISSPALAPAITTTAATAVGNATGTMNGNISSNGGQNITSYGFYWSTTNGFANGAGTQVVKGTTNFTGNLSHVLTGLTNGTTYYYKAYATNSVGTTYGEQQSFTPVQIVTGNLYINDGSFAAGDFCTAAGQDIAGNDGTPAKPFATLSYALSRSTQAPGDVIYIDAGTYSWSATHTFTTSGTVGSPITIQGKGRTETNVTSTTSTNSGLYFTTGNNWVVKDLSWTATSARTVFVEGATGITLDNCTFNITSTSTSLQSIIINNATGKLTIKNCTLTRTNTASHMIEIVAGASLTLLDNTISFSALILSGNVSSIKITPNASSVLIMERNKLYGGGYAVGITTGTNSAAHANTIIKNNFFHTYFGIVNSMMTGLKVYNNSFYTNGECVFGITPAFLTNWDIQNNIFYNNGSDTTRACVYYNSTSVHPTALNYNHYYHPNNGINGAVKQLTTYYSLANWKTTGNPASVKEANGQGGSLGTNNPLYVNIASLATSDLHLQETSPAIGAGSNVGVTDDIDGDARPSSGTFDIGADEFTAIQIVTGDLYINDGTFASGDFSTAAGQDIATNDGTPAKPFATLNYALSRSTQAPGDVIYIDAGTYSWPATHTFTTSGTVANPITIQGKGRAETIITSTTSTNSGLYFTTGSNWVVKDLSWSANNARTVWVESATGITLDNCDFTFTSASASLQSIIVNNAAGKLTIKNCTLTRSNTTFHMIEIVAGAALTLQDNTISFPALAAVGTATSVQMQHSASSVLIMERNKLFGGGYGVGIVVGTGNANANTIIKNNFFSTYWGIVNTRMTGLKVYHNSFYTNGECIFGIAPGFLTNWDIQNNILYTYGTSKACILSQSTTSHPAIMNYNHYYSPNTGAGQQTGSVLSFANWQTAAGGPWEANGQGGNDAANNPLFVNAAAGDLHLQPDSPAIGAGVDVGITDDIDGNVRPLSGSFEIGADEFIATVSSVATLSDLRVNGVSISGFSPVTTDYTVVVSCSVSTIPQITSATPTSPLASVVITQAPDVFEDATVVVTAEDGITTETYTVRIGLVRPDIIQDFEPPATYTGLTGDNGTTATIDSSPGGVTGNSLKLVSTSSGQTYQAGYFDQVSDFVVLTPENNTVKVDVYASQAFNLRLKLENGTAGNIERTQTYDGSALNTWQTLTYDFGAVNATYQKIVFFLNSNATNTGFLPSQNFTAFVDNISLSSVQTERVTYIYDNGWLPSDPTGIAGCLDTFEIASGNVNISADTEIESVTIQPGASMTIDTGVTLTATTVTLNSTSQQFSSLILNGSLNGTINYNRYTAQVGSAGTNDLISSPVMGQQFDDFVAANPDLAASGTIRAFAPYNTSAGAYQNYDAVANQGTILALGIGFRAGTTNGSPLTFTGTVSNADVLDVPIIGGGAGSSWNLIGNPYPSFIDFATFFDLNKLEFDAGGAFQAIYGYDGDTSNGWIVWNQASIIDNTITELIAPGQGFFVKAKASGGLVDFTATMRRFATDDDFIPGRSASSTNVAWSKLALTSPTKNALTSIYFIDGTTRGLDAGYDAGSYQGSSGGFSLFTNLVENNVGLDMAIQTLPYNDLNDVVVPLGVKALAGNSLTIGLEDNSFLPPSVNVYLEDTLENTLTLLNSADYTFTPTNDLVGTGRFFLRYSSQTLSINTSTELNDLIIYTNENFTNITIKGILTAATKADLYDIQGRVVLSEKLNQSNISNTIDVSAMSSGIYIIKVSNKDITKTQRIILK